MPTAQDPIADPLYVIAVVANPVRYRRRWELYRNFARHITDSGAKLLTVEAAFGDRRHAIAGDDQPVLPGEIGRVRLRTESELWHKENLINLGVQRLPPDWKYVAWIDADISFANPSWVDDTLHALQHYAIIQPWSVALDLGPTGEPFAQYKSFAASHLASVSDYTSCDHAQTNSAAMSGYQSGKPAERGWHTGLAWAARRDAWGQLGGLIDWAIVGSADFYMAWALLGDFDRRMYWPVADPARRQRGFSPAYIRANLQWQARAQALRQNIGAVAGTIVHHWHGRKGNRGYNDRRAILIDYQFDPDTDLRRDWQGLWQLHDDGSPRLRGMRDALRAYFRSRDEDSTWNGGS